MEYGNISLDSSLTNLQIGFIDKKFILSYVTQEEIFSLVFKFLPEEFEYVTSPFREDNNPNCFFQYLGDNVLYFRDFANCKIVNGVRMSHLDCFNAVMFYFKLPNFYSALVYIYNSLIQDQNRQKITLEERPQIKKDKFLIYPFYRSFDIRDKEYWLTQYGISSYNLQEDFVYAVEKYICFNTSKGDFLINCKNVTYAYTDFENKSIKIYSPYEKDKGKFITDNNNCSISGMRHLPFIGDILIITKAYKDYRVLRNEGYNAVWVSSESSLPDLKDLKNLIPRFKKIIVWFDNDKTGIEMAKVLSDYINSFYQGKSSYMWLPEHFLNKDIKDPSDFRKYSKEQFKNYLKTYICF